MRKNSLSKSEREFYFFSYFAVSFSALFEKVAAVEIDRDCHGEFLDIKPFYRLAAQIFKCNYLAFFMQLAANVPTPPTAQN